MSTQDQATIDTIVLVVYYEFAQTIQSRYGSKVVEDALQQWVSRRRVQVAVEKNLERGFIVRNDFGRHEAYEITRKGLDEIESYLQQNYTDVQFIIEHGPGEFFRRARNNQKRYPEQILPSSSVALDSGQARSLTSKYATKLIKRRLGLQEWAAVATLVGIPLAILLWWFS